MSIIPNYTVNSDKRTKLLQNGTPVSSSTSPQKYARPLNLITTGSGVTAAENTTSGNFDITFPAPPTVPVQSIANVGTGTGTIYRDTTSNTANLKTISAGTGITIVNNANDINISAPPAVTGVSPVTGKVWGLFMAGGMSGKTSSGIIGGSGFMANWNFVGASTAGADADGMCMYFTTTSTSGNAVEYYGDITAAITGYMSTSLNPTFWFKFKTPDITSTRMYLGFYDNNPLPTNSYNFLNSNKGFGLMYDYSAFNNYQVIWNNNASTNSDVDTGVVAVNNSVVNVKLWVDSANQKWNLSLNGGTAIQANDTNIPTLGGHLYGFILHHQNTSGVVRKMNVYYLYAESN